jgi:hypothetical protein
MSAVSTAPERPFLAEAEDRARDVGRLVEDVVDGDAWREDRTEAVEVLLHELDDAQRGGVGPLRHRDVDRPAAVHERVAGLDVGRVVDRSDVTHVDGSRPGRADRHVAELADVGHDGVHGDHRHEIADAHVARRTDHVAAADRGDHLVG